MLLNVFHNLKSKVTIVNANNAIVKNHFWGLINLLIGLVCVLCACNPIYGFVESNFLLAKESRLPVWISLPEGYVRDDVTVSLFLYTFNKAKFIVRGPGTERKILVNIVAKANWHNVTKEEVKRRGNYNFSPQYYSVIYQGVEDIISFPCKGPIFLMVDNAEKNFSSIQPECPSVDLDLIGNP